MKVPPLIISLKNIEKHKKHKKHKHKKHHKHHKHHKHQKLANISQLDIRHQQLNLEIPFLEPKSPQLDIEIPPLEPSSPQPDQKTPQLDSVSPQHNSKTPHPTPSSPKQDIAIPLLDPKSPHHVEAKSPKITEAEQTRKITRRQLQQQQQQQQPPQLQQPPSQSPKQIVTPEKRNDASAKISFLRMAEDGSVTMAIIGPQVAKQEDSNEKIMNLEQLCGQLTSGTDVIPSDIDEEKCREILQVKPVDCIEPDTFGSYLPIQDSTFANLTKDDTETLLEIYGGNATCYEYAKSLQDYAKGTNYLMTMVDSLLDLLTDGKHRKEAVPIRDRLNDQKQQEQMQKQQEQMQQQQPTQNSENQSEHPTSQPPPSEEEKHQNSSTTGVPEKNPNEKQSAEAENHTEKQGTETEGQNGADDPPMEVVEEKGKDTEEPDQNGVDALMSCVVDDIEGTDKDEVQSQLDTIDSLLSELKEIQERRLSASAAPIEPGEEESRIADEILTKMTRLIKEKAKPGEVCNSASIFKALGIPLTH